MKTVAALYIDPGGHYPKMAAVDGWDESRNAKRYRGPHPVVAHPPCGPWGNLNHQCNQDPACGPAAVRAVRKWGGVLEHPRGSRLWSHCDLPRPGAPPDAWGGFTVEVNQVAWGHVAKKPTWLYIVGATLREGEVRTGGTPTHWVEGSNRPPGIKACSAQLRRRTPPAFAEWLVSIARRVA